MKAFDTMDDSILLARDDQHIVTLTLNSPDKMNAMNLGMWQRLGDLMQQLDADDAVRCIVVTGAGERAFSAGADIEEFPQTRLNKTQALAYGKVTHRAMQAMAQSRHPTLAVIHGACVGGGLGRCRFPDEKTPGLLLCVGCARSVIAQHTLGGVRR